MNTIVNFPQTCIFCQQKTQDYELIENLVDPEAENEYMCSCCIALSRRCKAESDRLDREDIVRKKRQNFILL